MTEQLTHSLQVDPQDLDAPLEAVEEHERAEGVIDLDGRAVRVAIIAGGLTHERDVSIRSGRRVAGYLNTSGAEVKVFDLDDRLIEGLRAFGPDVVWPLVHGSSGEDGTLQNLLTVLRLPFVGARAAACQVASTKPIAKTVVERGGLSAPNSVTFPQSMFRELGARTLLDEAVNYLGLPLVIKPAGGGSALGVTRVEERTAAAKAMVDAFAYCDDVMIEQAVSGTEVAVSVVDLGDGPVALPPIEIVTDGPYDYDARYNPGRVQYFVPARLTDEQRAAVEETALRAHELLGLRHISRSDMILDDDGTVWFLDCNVAPGMTETSLLPLAAQRAGKGRLADIYLNIVRTALRDGK